jgi:hypothetical protein
MLPPRLRDLRDQIERKSQAQAFATTDAERELLSELRFLDEDREVSSAVRRGILNLEIKRVVGPAGNCPCCGRR